MACLVATISTNHKFTACANCWAENTLGWIELCAAVIVMFVGFWDFLQHKNWPKTPKTLPSLPQEGNRTQLETWSRLAGFVGGVLLIASAIFGCFDLVVLWNAAGGGYFVLCIMSYALHFLLLAPALCICVVECDSQWSFLAPHEEQLKAYKKYVKHYAAFLAEEKYRSFGYLFVACQSSTESRFYVALNGFYPQSIGWFYQGIAWYFMALFAASLLHRCIEGDSPGNPEASETA